MNASRAKSALVYESRLLQRVLFHRGYLLSKLALIAGAGYMFGPWDIIPNRIPWIGYSDQIGFLIAGWLLARFLVPIDADVALAGRNPTLFGPGDAVCSNGRGRLRASVQSAALVHWLSFRRRVLRLARRVRGGDVQARSRPGGAASRFRPGGGGDLFFGTLGYRWAWRLQTPFARRRSDTRSIVVIGGSARSGTTLLRTMLGRHSMLASCPETTVFLHRISSPACIAERLDWNVAEIEDWQRQSRSQVEFIERFAGAIRNYSGKPMWVEKTPKNVFRFGFVRRRFPNAKIIHIVRDGRDVVCSLRHKSFAKIDQAASAGSYAARRCAVQWRNSVKAGLRFRGDPNYYEMRYEDLVHDPAATLGKLMSFLELPWEAAILSPSACDGIDPYENRAAEQIFDRSVGRWREDLSDEDRQATRLLIGPQLIELGYQAGLDWDARLPKASGQGSSSASQ